MSPFVSELGALLEAVSNRRWSTCRKSAYQRTIIARSVILSGSSGRSPIAIGATDEREDMAGSDIGYSASLDVAREPMGMASHTRAESRTPLPPRAVNRSRK